MRRFWITAIAGVLVLAVPEISSAAQPAKKTAKKGPNIVLPGKKGGAKTTPTPDKKTNGRTDKPEKVDIPGITGSDKGNQTSGGGNNITDELRGPTRIDFDDRLIQGQTNKSGAVYLFDRKETGISSMVKRRKSFKQLTIGTIYDR